MKGITKLILGTLIGVLIGCSTPVDKVPHDVIADTNSVKTYIDWNYINKSDEEALHALIQDLMFNPKFEAPQHKGCFHSWSGGSNGFNCTNYGIFRWVVDETIRLDYALGYQFIRAHISHMTEYGYDWGNGLKPQFHHKPGGEGVADHPVWVGDNNRDSDISRHVHLAPYAYVLRLLQTDPVFFNNVAPTPTEMGRLIGMVYDWADNWYMKINYLGNRERGTSFQYGRTMVPARGLIEMFYLTKKWKYLAAAEYAFMTTFWKLEREVQGRNGSKFFSYDTGYEGEGRTQQLLYYAAHNNMESWQLGHMAEVAAHLYANTYNPLVAQVCKEVVIDVTDWVTRNKDIPLGDLIKEDDNKFIVSFFTGGSLTGVYNTPGSPQMDPIVALTLGVDTPFYPLSLLRSHLWDGKYYTLLLPNNKMRVHYPRNQVGPHASHPIMFNWANLLLARHLLTGKRIDLHWALWAYRDSKYFANRSSPNDKRKIEKPDAIHYGTGNIGKTRAFAWWAISSLWAKDALYHLDHQINK